MKGGDVRRVLRGVYAPTQLVDLQSTRAAALGLALGPHCVVADLAAAWLHGVPCYDPRDLDVPPGLHIVSIGSYDRSRRAELLGGTRTLLPDEVMTLDGVRVTTPIRTACDVASLRGRSRALAALDGFARAFDLATDDFAAVLPRFRGRRGCRQLRDLVPHVSPLAESPGESWTRLAIIDAGLPVPAPQRWVCLPAYGWVRLDLAHEHLRIAIEYDGQEFQGEDRRDHDDKRRAALRRVGWHVIVVTKFDLSGEKLHAWLGELRSEIAARRTPPQRRYARGPAA